MSEATVGLNDQLYRQLQERNARLGLVLWRLTNGMIFAFFAFANALMRQSQPSWPPPGVARLDAGIPIVFSVLLLISGVFAGRALQSIRRGDVKQVQGNIYPTLLLGAIFAVGISWFSTQIPFSGAYSSIIVAMHIFHVAHVVVASGLFIYVLRRSQQGVYSQQSHWSVEAAVVFWHFVDLMWIFFFLIIYVF
jgi:cytochrome c oxidase subunit III